MTPNVSKKTCFYRFAPYFLALFFYLLFFKISGAQGLIVCEGPNCTFNHLISLIRKIIDFLIMISVPLASISFAWAGFLLVSSGGSEEKKNKAKEIFSKTAIGFMIVLSAWLIVYFISVALLEDGVSLLGGSS